jgi:hypothetical protein
MEKKGNPGRCPYRGLLRGSLFTASRFAWLRVREYRTNILADIHPAMAFIVDSGNPSSPKASKPPQRDHLIPLIVAQDISHAN